MIGASPTLEEVLNGGHGHPGVLEVLRAGHRALCETLQSMLRPGSTLLSCSIVRADLKPGKYLTGYYDVMADGMTSPAPVVARWFRRGLGPRPAQLASAQDDLAQRGVVTPFDPLWTADESRRMLVQAAPLDPQFPSLGRLWESRRVPETLAACGRALSIPAGPYSVRPVRYRPGDRHVLEYRIGSAPFLFVKLYPTDRVASVSASAKVVADILETGPSPVRSIRPWCVLPELGATLYPHVPGTPWSHWLGAGTPVPRHAARQVGASVAALHCAPTTGEHLPGWDVRGDDEATDRSCQIIGTLRPDLGSVAARVVARARGRLASLEDEPFTATHGDLKAEHLLVRPSDVVVLDPDRCALADPARDLAMLLADLRYWSCVAGSAAGETERDFLEAYTSHPGRLARAWCHTALTLVKMAPKWLSMSSPEWEKLTSSVIARAEETLDEGAGR